MSRHGNSRRNDNQSRDAQLMGIYLALEIAAAEEDVPRNIPCRTSRLQGRYYIEEVLGNDTRCYENFRMNPHVFHNLCDTLRANCGIRNSRNGMTVEEMVGMFLMVVAHSTRLAVVAERFQHSKETVSQVIKNCIGAIDGTHVSACVPSSVRGAYRDRNNEITQNVLAACSHDMMFTYVVTGWKGSAHDSRILSDAATLELFPAPYGEQYYVVDAGFPNIPGYLAPYKGQRFAILRTMSNYGQLRQGQITLACFVLHNFIQLNNYHDRLFEEYGNAWEYYDEFRNPPHLTGNRVDVDMRSREMDALRNRIANAIWNAETRGNR
ncbi:protein ALP1-like [Punica granatum]|uniref:Protein ALP1-like n=1 Tax=Punica granatum TaxID=22663 RepID=A0A6P8D6J2_PUNGR|nr:protein ALP1-like [Punica granatum]